MKRAYLGIDLGTSGVKVVLLDQSGTTLARTSHGYPVTHPTAGAAESDPDHWWQATRTAVRDATRRAGEVTIAGIGVDGQMHGLVLTDAHGTALRPAITWADTRATAQAERWRNLPATARARLANPVVPGMTGPLLAWLLDHEPHTVDRAAAVLLAKDWLRMRLTGAPGSDPSDASATLLWDITADTWAVGTIAALGLPRHLLPPIIGSASQAGQLQARPATELGLPAAAPVATGAADTAAALYATAINPGQVLLTIGTGAQITQPLTRPETRDHPVTHLYRAVQPGHWYAMAAVQNGGLALDWARRLLGTSWDELYAAIDTPAADDPVFLPYLTGERTPVLDPHVRGAWTGLDLKHTRTDLLRAAATGVTCAIRHALTSLPGPAPPRLLTAGGGSRHSAMRQHIANMLGLPLAPLSAPDASPAGAAGLAADAAGSPIRREPPRSGPDIEPAPHRDQYDAAYHAYIHAAEAAAETAIPWLPGDLSRRLGTGRTRVQATIAGGLLPVRRIWRAAILLPPHH